jgi:hypothetical protein
VKIEEYGSGREGDVANDPRNGGKGERKGKRVGTWADREYGGDMAIKGKSRNTTPLLGLKTTQLHA